ncbi:hypothetical protein HK100_005401 [Physocladia obscura]|uniref:Uncharacterized protein n=1 Tax=Physocladia obscura TaxID=109957 RepID=A0AAD5STX8_9FUNG|nr:hypothetical protein HK100_005401 [Physocladia obscura]
MPPSFESLQGIVQYYIKCSLFVTEGLKLLKTNQEIEVPVHVIMPEAAKLKLLKSPSDYSHKALGTSAKVGLTITLRRRIVAIGDNLEVGLSIFDTPGTTRLRSFSASLRSVMLFLNDDNRGAQAPVTRPLSEVTQTFPLIRVGRHHGAVAGAGDGFVDQISQRLFLLIDPEVAKASMESPLISIRTLLRLQITLDDSETPNVSFEVPIVVVPEVKAVIPPSPPAPPQIRRANTINSMPQRRPRQQHNQHGPTWSPGMSFGTGSDNIYMETNTQINSQFIPTHYQVPSSTPLIMQQQQQQQQKSLSMSMTGRSISNGSSGHTQQRGPRRESLKKSPRITGSGTPALSRELSQNSPPGSFGWYGGNVGNFNGYSGGDGYFTALPEPRIPLQKYYPAVPQVGAGGGGIARPPSSAGSLTSSTRSQAFDRHGF